MPETHVTAKYNVTSHEWKRSLREDEIRTFVLTEKVNDK